LQLSEQSDIYIVLVLPDYWQRGVKVNKNRIIAINYALVAQLDRATDYESVGRGFESLQARQSFQGVSSSASLFFYFLTQILTQMS
jgi:hypothetical protein